MELKSPVNEKGLDENLILVRVELLANRDVKSTIRRTFLGSPLVKILRVRCGVWVQSLFGKLNPTCHVAQPPKV